VPLGMFERSIDMAPGSGAVHQNHGGDGDAAKDV